MTTTTAFHEDTTHEDEFVEKIWNLTGGEDAYRTMITWVKYTWSSEEADEYDRQMDSDDPEVVKAAALDLFIKYKAACDQDPNLDADMDARRRMSARENMYSEEAIKVFKYLDETALNAKDCLQMARVLASMAAKKFKDLLDEQMEDDESSKFMTSYHSTNFTLATAAKNLLWNAQLPHEYLADEDEEEQEEGLINA